MKWIFNPSPSLGAAQSSKHPRCVWFEKLSQHWKQIKRKAKQSGQKKKLGVSNSSPFWELFEMLSFLSHGQFCTLTDYIWRPAGLQNQTPSTAFHNHQRGNLCWLTQMFLSLQNNSPVQNIAWRKSSNADYLNSKFCATNQHCQTVNQKCK